MAKKRRRESPPSPPPVEAPAPEKDPLQIGIDRRLAVRKAQNWRREIRRQLLNEMNGIRD